ncbi:MAG: BatD family protein [Polyangiaceae bacterium]
MRRALGRSGLALALFAGCVTPRPARADTNLSTEVSAQRVEVNEPFTVQVTLMSSDSGTITGAKLPAPPGLQVRGPSTQSRSQLTITNGQMVRQTGVTLSWTVIAQKPGTYRIGPPTLEFSGQSYKGTPRSIEVVAEGSGGGRGRRGGPDPFDPFGMFQGMPGFPGFPGMGRGFPFPDADEPEPQQPQLPPDFQLERAPDPVAFLISKASPRKVVVGQAVSLKILAYGGRGMFQPVSPTEPSRDGFLSYDVEPDPQGLQFQLNGQTMIAMKARDLVLFPIQSGTLRIGSMKLGFKGRGYPPGPGAAGLMRESPPIEITVVEPPLKGRPPGYHIGDVGQYKLEANVEPRQVKQGEAVSVIATLAGTGNVPAKLDVPQQNGVDWMEPTTIEKLEARDGNVRGSRSFTFVVKLEKAGKVDLGELALPFYNPERGAYEVARVGLGEVQVEAQADKPSAPAAKGPEDRLQGLLSPPTTLGPTPQKARYWADGAGFFGVLAGGPLSVLALSGLTRLGGSLLHRRRVQQATPARRAALELEVARKLADSDHLGACAALDRALHLAIEATTSLKGRGILRSELGRELRAQKVPDELAHDVVTLLETLENARFVAKDEQEPTHALVERCERSVRELSRSSRG